MEKAVIEIDMPKICYECNFCDADKNLDGKGNCLAACPKISLFDGLHKRHENCPIVTKKEYEETCYGAWNQGFSEGKRAAYRKIIGVSTDEERKLPAPIYT